MDKKNLILAVLKPKVKALGFNKEDLKSLAADIAENLEIEDTAEEEEVNAKVEKLVDAVIPSLKIAQKAINRSIQQYKDAHPVNNDESENDDAGKDTIKDKESNETPEWAKSLLTLVGDLQGEVAKMKGEKVAETRKEKLAKLVKDSGTYGAIVLKSFDKMKFDNSDEFDDFMSDVESNMKKLNQERANNGLGKLGSPATNDIVVKEDVNPLSDGELQELADSF